jgi:hypothetical protein
MNFARFAAPILLVLTMSAASASSYQIRTSAGLDRLATGSDQPSSYLLQAQISTLSRFIRFHSAFAFLNGAEYMEGEAVFGTSLYLLAPFVGTRAPVQPYLAGGASAGFGVLREEQRLDLGPYYGAGVDLKTHSRSGFNISVEHHLASAKSIRFLLGFYWVKGELN